MFNSLWNWIIKELRWCNFQKAAHQHNISYIAHTVVMTHCGTGRSITTSCCIDFLPTISTNNMHFCYGQMDRLLYYRATGFIAVIDRNKINDCLITCNHIWCCCLTCHMTGGDFGNVQYVNDIVYIISGISLNFVSCDMVVISEMWAAQIWSGVYFNLIRSR